MPFKLRKAPKRPLQWVVDDTGKHYSKDPLPKEQAREQQKALQASEKRGGMDQPTIRRGTLVPSATSAFSRPSSGFVPPPALSIPSGFTMPPSLVIPPRAPKPFAPIQGKRRLTRLEREVKEGMRGRKKLSPIPEIEGEGKKVGSGAQPPRDVMLAIAKQAQETQPAKEVAGYRLAVSTPTIKIYTKDNTSIVGIRGTQDKTDLKADAAVAAGTLSSSQRYKKDASVVRAYRASYPDHSVYGVGHSLGGAILDQFLKEGLVQSGVSYNPAVQTGDYQAPLANQRIYNEGDPLYQLSGQHTEGVEVRKEEKSLPRRLISAIPYFGRLQDAYQSHKLDSFRGGARTPKQEKLLAQLLRASPAVRAANAPLLEDLLEPGIPKRRSRKPTRLGRRIEALPEMVDPVADLEAEKEKLVKEYFEVSLRMIGASDEEREALQTRKDELRAKSEAIEDEIRGLEGSGRSKIKERNLRTILTSAAEGQRGKLIRPLKEALEPGEPIRKSKGKIVRKEKAPIGRTIVAMSAKDLTQKERDDLWNEMNDLMSAIQEQEEAIEEHGDKVPKKLLAKKAELERQLEEVEQLQEQAEAKLKGSGKSLADQIREAGQTEASYLAKARRAAKKEGQDPKKLVFAEDGEHKLSQDGVKFGRVGQGDFLLWSGLEKQGKAPKGKAKEKRDTFRKSHLAMKGKWRENKMSPNWLAINILWN